MFPKKVRILCTEKQVKCILFSYDILIPSYEFRTTMINVLSLYAHIRGPINQKYYHEGSIKIFEMEIIYVYLWILKRNKNSTPLVAQKLEILANTLVVCLLWFQDKPPNKISLNFLSHYQPQLVVTQQQFHQSFLQQGFHHLPKKNHVTVELKGGKGIPV